MPRGDITLKHANGTLDDPGMGTLGIRRNFPRMHANRSPIVKQGVEGPKLVGIHDEVHEIPMWIQ